MDNVERCMDQIASRHNRLDGLVAAAGISHAEPGVERQPGRISDLMRRNYNGAFRTATAGAQQMRQKKCNGSILLVADIGESAATEGETGAVHDSAKASIIQLTRCLAMEWGRADSQESGAIRVNCLCPGHIVTSMTERTLNESPKMKEEWERSNMLGRLSRPEEYRGAALFLLSDASSFMTGTSRVVDGGHKLG